MMRATGFESISKLSLTNSFGQLSASDPQYILWVGTRRNRLNIPTKPLNASLALLNPRRAIAVICSCWVGMACSQVKRRGVDQIKPTRMNTISLLQARLIFCRDAKSLRVNDAFKGFGKSDGSGPWSYRELPEALDSAAGGFLTAAAERTSLSVAARSSIDVSGKGCLETKRSSFLGLTSWQ